MLQDHGGTYGNTSGRQYDSRCHGSKETPDSCKWDDVNINGLEVNRNDERTYRLSNTYSTLTN